MIHLKSSYCINKHTRFFPKGLFRKKPRMFNLLKINELPPQYLYQFIVILYLSSLNTSILSAQTTSVKGTKTDKVFANTTEIYKSKAASDVQVLAELENDYGIGDVVRISNAPPVATTVPLPQTTSIQSEKKPLPSIPKTYPLSNQALVITSGSYKSDIEMPEKKLDSEKKSPKATESNEVKKSKAYTPPSVKSSKSAKSYKKSNTSSKRFLFFFKKSTSKSSKRAKYKDNNKFGCYKF